MKLYENMIEYSSRASRNWKLMHLNTNNLSHDQIKKIDYSIENAPEEGTKMKLIKMMIREGVPNFNIDSFYTSLKACTVNRWMN